jgi:hypothetical protein
MVSFGLLRKTILAVLIGLMGGGAAVLAQPAGAGDETQAVVPAEDAASAAPAQEAAPDAVTAAPAVGEAKPSKATAKAAKKLAAKANLKKVKQPKLMPLHIVEGTLTVDGWTGKAEMNYDIADLKYLYIWVPGVGTVVVSNGPFPQGEMQAKAFSGNMLTLNVSGHTIQIASDKQMLGKKPEPAFVHVDADYQLASTFPAMGYGNTPLAPYAWPGAKNVRTAKAGVVAPPPLPVELRPVGSASASLVAPARPASPAP